MHKRILVISLLLVSSLSASAQSRSDNKTQSKVENKSTISYCELFRNPNLYLDGQQVRVQATWKYGFEWSYLYDRECMEQPKAMVEFVDEENLGAASKRNLKEMKPERFDNKADVIVVGQLRDCGGCGHMGSYQYKFVVTCLENYKKIQTDVP